MTESPASGETPSESQKELTSFAIVKAPETEEQKTAIIEAERLDEEMIIAELKGHVFDKLFHEIEVRGQKQVVLSWPGTKYFTLQQKHISIEEVKLNESDDSYRAMAWARDKVRDVRVLGAAEQSKTIRLKDGTRIPDEFALAKVVSKSQRNALRNLIPEPMIAEAYKLWKARQPVAPADPQSATTIQSRASSVEWHVPVTKQFIDLPKVNEYPLQHGSKTIGQINVDAEHGELAFVPEARVKPGAAPFQKFLVVRILNSIVEQHPDTQYFLRVDAEGFLEAVLVRTSAGPARLVKLIEELHDPVAWSFAKAAES